MLSFGSRALRIVSIFGSRGHHFNVSPAVSHTFVYLDHNGNGLLIIIRTDRLLARILDKSALGVGFSHRRKTGIDFVAIINLAIIQRKLASGEYRSRNPEVPSARWRRETRSSPVFFAGLR